MCGIAGWVRREGGPVTEDPGLAKRMAHTMACRGPDGQGVRVAGPATLIQTRLAVIDVPGGIQPMAAPPPGPPRTRIPRSSRTTARSTTSRSCAPN